MSDEQTEIGRVLNANTSYYPTLLNRRKFALISIPYYIFAFLLYDVLYPEICEDFIYLYLISPLVYHLLPLDLISTERPTLFSSLDHLAKRSHIPDILSLLIVLNNHLLSQLNSLKLFHSLRRETPDFVRVQVLIKDIIAIEGMDQLVVRHLELLAV